MNGTKICVQSSAVPAIREPIITRPAARIETKACFGRSRTSPDRATSAKKIGWQTRESSLTVAITPVERVTPTIHPHEIHPAKGFSISPSQSASADITRPEERRGGEEWEATFGPA